MEKFDRTWLIVNAASGSNTPAALDELRASFAAHGITVDRTVNFPDDDLPLPADLDQAGIELVAIYTGDGTLNSALGKLKGWGGAVLVLPGGTMNLLSKRLHGNFPASEILDVVARGGARRRRLAKIAGPCGDAYAGLMAGPGTRWGDVREAIRDLDIAAMASGTAEALSQATAENMIRVVEPALRGQTGYQLIDMTPGEHGIQMNGYNAATAGEWAQQGWAMLFSNFREGPHDRLGVAEEVTLESSDGSPVKVLLDGEPCDGGPRVTFRVADTEVDLLATHHG